MMKISDMSLIIRPAMTEDIPLLIQTRLNFLSALGYPVSDCDFPKASHQMEVFLHEHLNNNLFALLAFEEAALAATGFLQVFNVIWHPAAPNGTYGRIINILTLPDYRRQGLARAIMQGLIQKAQELNLSYLDLDASPDGQPLYESLGFSLLQANHPPMRLIL